MSITFEDGVIKTPNFKFDENCGGIGNIYFNAFKKYRDRLAMIKASTDEFCTYSEFLEKCIRTALVLQKQGFKKQDLIAVCSNKENLNANVPTIAGQFLGLITFSLDPKLTVNECSDLIAQVQPKIIFIIDESKHMITRSLEINNAKTKLVCFGKNFEDEYLKPQEDEDRFEPLFIHNLYDTCIIHFSSGSTGLPKPICLNHYYFLALQYGMNFLHLSAKRKEKFADKPLGQVSLRFANWYWVSTSFEFILYFPIGGCRILWESFDGQKVWKLIEKYSITNLSLTPLQAIELALSNKPDGVNISSITDISTGGQVLHKEYVYKLREIFPGTHIYQAYGMTECGLATIFHKNKSKDLMLLAERPDSCGRPVEGLYYKIIDIETGKKCGPNQPGELYLKGKVLLNGFYNKDASESFDKEGYFRTGDLVLFDEDYCFYIIDRIKSILGWNDWLIYPYHIEKVLLEHPSVHDAVVIGIPHKIEGERLMGVVILKKDAQDVTETDLIKYVDARVDDHKRLREGITFMNKFPVTITGKVSRIKIKNMVLNNLAI